MRVKQKVTTIGVKKKSRLLLGLNNWDDMFCSVTLPAITRE